MNSALGDQSLVSSGGRGQGRVMNRPGWLLGIAAACICAATLQLVLDRHGSLRFEDAWVVLWWMLVGVSAACLGRVSSLVMHRRGVAGWGASLLGAVVFLAAFVVEFIGLANLYLMMGGPLT